MSFLVRTQNKNKIVIYPFLCRIYQYMFYCNVIVFMYILKIFLHLHSSKNKQSCNLEYDKTVNEFLFIPAVYINPTIFTIVCVFCMIDK